MSGEGQTIPEAKDVAYLLLDKIEACGCDECLDRAMAIISKAILAERERGGWQDIVSAPKDQTSIWLGHVGGLTVPAYFRRTGSGFWTELYTNLPVSWRPTHWRPLPTPPTPTHRAIDAAEEE